jgi:hypothetical protein
MVVVGAGLGLEKPADAPEAGPQFSRLRTWHAKTFGIPEYVRLQSVHPTMWTSGMEWTNCDWIWTESGETLSLAGEVDQLYATWRLAGVSP